MEEEREKTCIICNKREVMTGFICQECQERIQQEVMSRRREIRLKVADTLHRETNFTKDNDVE